MNQQLDPITILRLNHGAERKRLRHEIEMLKLTLNFVVKRNRYLEENYEKLLERNRYLSGHCEALVDEMANVRCIPAPNTGP